MSTTQKPEALRLADKYEAHGFLGDHSFAKEQWCSQAAVELRSQHARIAELEAQLSAIAHTAEGATAQTGTYADAPMVDMTPPATSRDRWMYEQGRLAERDARTPGSVAAAAQVVLPEPVPSGMRLVNAGALQMVINAMHCAAMQKKARSCAVKWPMSCWPLSDEQIAVACGWKAVPLYTALPAQADALDAARYRWLRNQMLGVDFDWGENGITALCFEMPEDGCAYGSNCDQNIDAAIAAKAKQGE